MLLPVVRKLLLPSVLRLMGSEVTFQADTSIELQREVWRSDHRDVIFFADSIQANYFIQNIKQQLRFQFGTSNCIANNSTCPDLLGKLTHMNSEWMLSVAFQNGWLQRNIVGFYDSPFRIHCYVEKACVYCSLTVILGNTCVTKLSNNVLCIIAVNQFRHEWDGTSWEFCLWYNHPCCDLYPHSIGLRSVPNLSRFKIGTTREKTWIERPWSLSERQWAATERHGLEGRGRSLNVFKDCPRSKRVGNGGGVGQA